MRILIIGNGNILSMPYLHYYEDVLVQNGIDYDLLYWDRLDLEESNKSNYIRFVQKSSGAGPESLIGYLKYYRYGKSFFKSNKYDVYIVFTMQMAILFGYLLRNKPYILDIRDYTYEYLPIYRELENRLVDGSIMNTISSEGFLEWLPKGHSYTISNNISFNTKMEGIIPFDFETHNISYVGAIRYINGNLDFLKVCKEFDDLEVHYYGVSLVGTQISDYCNESHIHNVIVHGMYDDNELPILYGRSNFILSVYGTFSMNTRTLLPNRLFGACALKRPIIVSSGTYLSDTVNKYGLGIVFDPNDPQGFRSQLDWYYLPENYYHFCENCDVYLAQASHENEQFPIKLMSILNKYNNAVYTN